MFDDKSLKIGYYTNVDLSKSCARTFHVLEVASRLDNISLVSGTEGEYVEEFSDFFSREDVESFKLSSRSYLSIKDKVDAFKFFKNQGVDVLYCRDDLLDFFPYMAKKFLKVPVIVEINNDNRYLMRYQKRKIRFAGPLIELIQRKNMRAADKVVFTCEGLKKRFDFLESDKKEVVGDSAPKKYIEYSDNEKYEQETVCYLGNLSEFKGVEKIPKLAEILPEVRFLIIGEGHLRENMERYIEDNNIGNVEFTGRLPRPKALEKVSRSHISILPYPKRFKNYFSPFKLFESLAVGTPVVTTPKGEPQNIVKETEGGIVVGGFGFDEMAEGIEKVLEDKEKYYQIRENGVKGIEEEYNWDNKSDKIFGLIEEVK